MESDHLSYKSDYEESSITSEITEVPCKINHPCEIDDNIQTETNTDSMQLKQECGNGSIEELNKDDCLLIYTQNEDTAKLISDSALTKSININNSNYAFVSRMRIINLKQHDDITNVFNALNIIAPEKINHTLYAERVCKCINYQYEFQWDAENLLILDLLSTNYSEREALLLKIAEKNKLLIKNVDKFDINPDLLSLNLNTIPKLDLFINKYQNPKLKPTVENICVKEKRKHLAVNKEVYNKLPKNKTFTNNLKYTKDLSSNEKLENKTMRTLENPSTSNLNEPYKTKIKNQYSKTKNDTEINIKIINNEKEKLFQNDTKQKINLHADKSNVNSKTYSTSVDTNFKEKYSHIFYNKNFAKRNKRSISWNGKSCYLKDRKSNMDKLKRNITLRGSTANIVSSKEILKENNTINKIFRDHLKVSKNIKNISDAKANTQKISGECKTKILFETNVIDNIFSNKMKTLNSTANNILSQRHNDLVDIELSALFSEDSSDLNIDQTNRSKKKRKNRNRARGRRGDKSKKTVSDNGNITINENRNLESTDISENHQFNNKPQNFTEKLRKSPKLSQKDQKYRIHEVIANINKKLQHISKQSLCLNQKKTTEQINRTHSFMSINSKENNKTDVHKNSKIQKAHSSTNDAVSPNHYEVVVVNAAAKNSPHTIANTENSNISNEYVAVINQDNKKLEMKKKIAKIKAAIEAKRCDNINSSDDDRISSSSLEKSLSKTIEKTLLNDNAAVNTETTKDISMESTKKIMCAAEINVESTKKIMCSADIQSSRHILWNTESLLVIELLAMNNEQREEHLIKIAKTKNLLQESKISSFLWNLKLEYAVNVMNPKIKSLVEKQVTAPLSEYEKMSERLFDSSLLESEKIMCILNKFHMGPDYFINPNNISLLEKFVDTLVKEHFGKIIEGSIRVNESDCNLAYISNAGERDAIIYSIPLRKYAMHGDVVKAFLFTHQKQPIDPFNTNSDQPEKQHTLGFVVQILEELNSRMVVGLITGTKGTHFLLTPTTKRVPEVKITKSIENIFFEPKKDSLYLAKIIEWQNRNPIAQIVRDIGKYDLLSTKNTSILLKNNLHTNTFSNEILTTLPSIPFVIPLEEYKTRDLMTKDCVFTIDPETARDLDDALSCKQLNNEIYEVGVHISDVSYFLKENSDLDKMVQKQSTTIYLVDTVFHMLPKPLCMLCSLLPGEDKLTFSVFFEMTANGEILQTRFARTIINSCSQLSYSHAQELIENPNKIFDEKELPTIKNGFTSHDISVNVNILHSIASKLRQERFRRGALTIDQAKFSFDLNPETGEPTDFHAQTRLESNNLIEEYMLLANQAVAKFIFEKYPKLSILRNHGPPIETMMNEISIQLGYFDLELDISSSRGIAESFNAIINKSTNSEALKCVLNKMIAKSMVRAEYVCSGMVENTLDLWHFALSIPIYTHFTSPIRRYPDILVHRLLSAGLALTSPPRRLPKELHKIAINCNLQKYNAKLASEDSSNLYFIRYIKSIKSLKMKAVVKNIFENYIDIALIATGHNIRIRLHDQPNVQLQLLDTIPCSADLTFINNIPEINSVTIKMFSEINVEVFVKTETLKAKVLPS